MVAVDIERADIAVWWTTILRDVSLEIADGEFLGVIGPSGGGKTTLLRAIAGFSDIASGTVRFDGVDMSSVKVADRDVAMVFQDAVLFGHRSVERNVAFPLEVRHRPVDEIHRRVDAEVRAWHLEHLLDRHPDTLSNGEAQLVQIARAMVRRPSVLLLDEPLATLDAATRRQMRAELRILQEGYGVTTIIATNDGQDAMQMPSRLAVLGAGRVVQVASPADVRRSPATLDAAVATGEISTIRAQVERGGDGFWLVGAGAPTFRHRAWAPGLSDRVGDDVLVGVRPEDVVVTPTGPISARVARVIPGHVTNVLCDLAGQRIAVHSDVDVVPGDQVALRVEHVVVFDPTSGFSVL